MGWENILQMKDTMQAPGTIISDGIPTHYTQDNLMKTLFPLLILLVILLFTTACAAPPVLAVEDAWARPGFKGDNSAVYLKINNRSDQGDGLIGAACDVALGAEVHLSKMDAQGTMTMERQDLVGIPAHQVVALEPGSLHIMLIDLVKDLQVGDTFELTLQFQRIGDLEVQVEVKGE